MIVSVAPLLKQPVGTEVAFAFAEDPIDPQGDNAALIEAGFESVDARLTATHTNPGPLLEGEARGTMEQQCSRCLRPVKVPVDATFVEQYYATIGVLGQSLEAVPDDVKTIGSDFLVDLTELVAEELVLATPLAPLCRRDCKGLCLECGEDLNDHHPHMHDDPTDLRWSKLQALRDFRPERDETL